MQKWQVLPLEVSEHVNLKQCKITDVSKSVNCTCKFTIQHVYVYNDTLWYTAKSQSIEINHMQAYIVKTL